MQHTVLDAHGHGVHMDMLYMLGHPSCADRSHGSRHGTLCEKGRWCAMLSEITNGTQPQAMAWKKRDDVGVSPFGTRQ